MVNCQGSLWDAGSEEIPDCQGLLFEALQSWPKQEEVTCHNMSILRILVGFSQFHPLGSMQKSHNGPLNQWGILPATPQDPVSFSHFSSGASLKSGPNGHPQGPSPGSDTQHPRTSIYLGTPPHPLGGPSMSSKEPSAPTPPEWLSARPLPTRPFCSAACWALPRSRALALPSFALFAFLTFSKVPQ